jgi:hypothetical protein
MTHLVLEAKWGSQDWELLGIANKNDIDKVNRLYELFNDWSSSYPDSSKIEFRIREANI